MNKIMTDYQILFSKKAKKDIEQPATKSKITGNFAASYRDYPLRWEAIERTIGWSIFL